MTTNGEVEAPAEHVSWRAGPEISTGSRRALATSASRPPPTIVRGRKHRSTVPAATVVRKAKQPQEMNRVVARARNPQRELEQPTGRKPPTSTEAAAVTERNHERREYCCPATARARTGDGVDRRVFGLHSCGSALFS
jgi:hypothetical protein